MKEDFKAARERFINGLSRIADFWGFPKAMGAIFGALYLSPEPLSLDEIVSQVGVTKGAVSINVRNLERLRMIEKHVKVGDRRDYYLAETDFWKIIKNVLRERGNTEFDSALRAVRESLDLLTVQGGRPSQNSEREFLADRIAKMDAFFHNLDSLVAVVLALEDLKSVSLKKLLKK